MAILHYIVAYRIVLSSTRVEGLPIAILLYDVVLIIHTMLLYYTRISPAKVDVAPPSRQRKNMCRVVSCHYAIPD